MMMRLGSFSFEELCHEAESELGYSLKDPVRKRMIFNLLNILSLIGYIGWNGELYYTKKDLFLEHLEFNGEVEDIEKYSSLFEDEILFFSSCIEYANNFLKGAPALYNFQP